MPEGGIEEGLEPKSVMTELVEYSTWEQNSDSIINTEPCENLGTDLCKINTASINLTTLEVTLEDTMTIKKTKVETEALEQIFDTLASGFAELVNTNMDNTKYTSGIWYKKADGPSAVSASS